MKIIALDRFFSFSVYAALKLPENWKFILVAISLVTIVNHVDVASPVDVILELAYV